MIRKISIVITLFMIGYYGYSQSGAYVPKVIPPSPDAASLGKFGEFPVGKYTGSASISIPIYTISSGGIEIPISLGYNASGIKAEEQSSWVGLGWSLNAGGAIAISTVGLSDFRPSSGLLNHSYDLTTFPALSEQAKKDLVTLINMGSLDVDPDIYNYNINGNAGRFLIDKATMQAITIPKSDLQINLPGTNPGNDWEILDAKGNKFIFNKREISVADDRVGNVHSFNSTYYLTKIITTTNEEILFNYQSYTNLYYIRNTSTKDYIDPLNISNPEPDCMQPYKENYSLMEIQGFRIESIIWDGGKALFKKNLTSREDMLNDYSLQVIEIYDKQNVLLKKFNLAHDYFGGVGGENFSTFLTSQMPNKRLRLLNVTESDPANNSLNPYSFEYHENVPYYFTRAQDLWGYYNGSSSNTTLLPKLSQTLGDANRKVNEVAAKGGSLKKITYPTKGFTEFNYESNDALVPASLYYNYEEPVHSPTIEPSNVTAYLGAGQNFTNLAVPVSVTGTDLLKKFTYTITYPSSINCPGTNRDCTGNLEIQLISSDNQHFIDLIAAGTFVNGVSSGEIWLQAGKTYTLSKYGSGINNNTTCQVIGKANPQIFMVNAAPYINVKTGGLRIASIVSNAGVGPSTTKKYFYHANVQAPESEKLLQPSSGSLSSFPVFSYQTVTVGVNYLCSKFIMSANSMAPLAVNGGSTTGYKFCQEVAFSPTEQQKTITEFLSNSDFQDSYSYSYPFVNEQSRDYLRGHVLHEDKYKMNGASFQIVSKESNTYNYVEPSYRSIVGCKNGCIDFLKIYGGVSDCQNFIFKNYRIATKWFYKNSTESKVYNNGILALTNLTNYFYDNDQHLQLTRTETINSQGNQIRTTLKYPADFVASPGNPANVYNSMVNKHQIGEVIEEVKTNISANKELQRVKTNYWEFNGGQQIEPISIQKSINNANLETEIQFNAYDAKGNLIEYVAKDGIVHSILWGYGDIYPVAKIVNKSYTDAITQSGINLSIVNNPTSETALRTELDKLRLLPGVIVTSFTYKPLIGISSQSDANNITTYYEYDAFGRLSIIRDKDNNILKKICYNYSGQAETCPIDNSCSPNWQNTSPALRCQVVNNVNTGYQEQEQSDLNNCNPGNTIRWVVAGYNPAACPLPSSCNSSNCVGDNKKCVNGVCETGVLKIISTRRQKVTGQPDENGMIPWWWQYYCTSAYCFSDGTYVGAYEYPTSGFCTPQICN